MTVPTDAATLEPDAARSVAALDRPTTVGGTRVTEIVDEDGRRIVLKEAVGGDRARIRREAAVLRSLGGPDLVRLLEVDDDGDRTRLVLLHSGGPALAALLRDPGVPPSSAVRAIAAACALVARLHATGWSHGDVRPDHLVTTTRGRVRLCSLSIAAPIADDPHAAARDRAALLRMVDHWTDSPPTGLHAWARLRRGLVERRLRRRTRRLVDDPDPLVLERILRRAAGRGPATVPHPLRRRDGRRRSQRPAIVGVATVAAVVSIGALVITTAGRSAPAASERPRTERPPAPDRASCADLTVATPDVDGDGCGNQVHVEGTDVWVDDVRYRVGAPGDVVAVGDWDCDGNATTAVLRPGTGELFEFAGWARPGHPADGRLLDVVPGATDLRSPPTLCGDARLSMADGSVRPAGVSP